MALFKTKIAENVWATKYRYNGESPLGTFERVANAAASVEEKDKEIWAEKFLKTLVKFDKDNKPIGLKCTPGGRITANVGTHYKATTIANCFCVGPISGATVKYVRKVPNTDIEIPCEISGEETPDNLVNIMLTLLEQAETLKSEGGYGINFDFIRPRSSLIEGVGIKHPGVVAYMTLWDKVSEIIVQSDADGYEDKLKNYLPGITMVQSEKLKKMVRKGAMMGSLSISHPDIEEFIRVKQTTNKLSKFNLSVLVDDKFMIATQEDKLYNLTFNGKVYKIIKARELYDLIMKSTYDKAEPGILFADNMSANNPIEYLGKCNVCNPCGEIPGNPFTSTVCNLGSVNLTQYVKSDRTFDSFAYEEDIAIFARMMDNFCDLTFAPLSQYNWSIKNLRQFGMGINGLGSTLLMLGLKFGSKEANEFIEWICQTKEEICWKTSALLAQEKGTFPAYSEKFLKTNWFGNFTAISEDTCKLIEKFGVRNAKTTTNPPLGNTSVMCDNVSNGIEPVFQLEYERTYITNSWPDGLNADNVKSILKREKKGGEDIWIGIYDGIKYLYDPNNRGLCICEPVRDYGYQWLLDNVFTEEDWQGTNYIVTTSDLTVENHLDVQEIVQRNLNQSTSKTVNIPSDYPFEDFKNLYMQAWERGLNGITTYRDGTRAGVLNKIEDIKENVVKKDLKLPDTFINGPMKILKREGSKYYINFSYLPEDKDMKHPVCFWINTNDHGEAVAVNPAIKKLAELLRKYEIDNQLINKQLEKIKGNRANQKLSKMVSMCLRHNLPITDIVSSLEGLEDDYISSLLTCVRKFLALHIEDGVKISGKACSSCGSKNLVYQSGCSLCQDCGSSGCG